MTKKRHFLVLVTIFRAFSLQAAPTHDERDLGELAIDVGRYNVLFARATSGLGVSLPQVLRGGGPAPKAAAVWRELRESGRDGVILKELACAKGAAGAKECRAFTMPTWIEKADRPVPGLAALRNYERELNQRFEPFVRVGCRAGELLTKDPLYCSVE